MFLATSSFAEPVHECESGTEISHRKYEEPGVMEQKGIMYGILGSYTYRDNFMLRAEGLYSFGEVDYENSGTMDNIDDYVLEFRGVGGYDFPVSKDKVFTPYIGIGYRYLNNEFGPGRYTSTGAAGYERESTYIYSPIGIEGIYALKNGWTLGITVEYDYFWKGTQKSHMGWVSGYYDIENDQERGYGLRGSVEFKKKGKKVDYVIEPFVRYWNIKDSEIITDPGGTPWIEPKNNTKEFGIKFTLKFSTPDLK